MKRSERFRRPPDFLINVLVDGMMPFSYRTGVRTLLGAPLAATSIAAPPALARLHFEYAARIRPPEGAAPSTAERLELPPQQSAPESADPVAASADAPPVLEASPHADEWPEPETPRQMSHREPPSLPMPPPGRAEAASAPMERSEADMPPVRPGTMASASLTGTSGPVDPVATPTAAPPVTLSRPAVPKTQWLGSQTIDPSQENSGIRQPPPPPVDAISPPVGAESVEVPGVSSRMEVRGALASDRPSRSDIGGSGVGSLLTGPSTPMASIDARVVPASPPRAFPPPDGSPRGSTEPLLMSPRSRADGPARPAARSKASSGATDLEEAFTEAFRPAPVAMGTPPPMRRAIAEPPGTEVVAQPEPSTAFLSSRVPRPLGIVRRRLQHPRRIPPAYWERRLGHIRARVLR